MANMIKHSSLAVVTRSEFQFGFLPAEVAEFNEATITRKTEPTHVLAITTLVIGDGAVSLAVNDAGLPDGSCSGRCCQQGTRVPLGFNADVTLTVVWH